MDNVNVLRVGDVNLAELTWECGFDIAVDDILSAFVTGRANTAYKAARTLGIPLSTAYEKFDRALKHGLLEPGGSVTARGALYCLCKKCAPPEYPLAVLREIWRTDAPLSKVGAFAHIFLKGLAKLCLPLYMAPAERLSSAVAVLLALLRNQSVDKLPEILGVDHAVFRAAAALLGEGLARIGLAQDLGTHYLLGNVVICKTECGKYCKLDKELEEYARKIAEIRLAPG